MRLGFFQFVDWEGQASVAGISGRIVQAAKGLTVEEHVGNLEVSVGKLEEREDAICKSICGVSSF